MPKKAFVTGGTGFIGINLLNLLVQVVALHRSSSDLTAVKKLPVSLREGSVTDLHSLQQAIPEDTDTIFHLAGDTNMWSKRNDLQHEINVSGTKNMVTAAAEKKVGTFIHTSSVAAWGKMSGTVTEETPQKGKNSWVNYEYTKWAGEQEALKGQESGMNVVILNPAAVTGPHDKNNWGRLFIALKEGTLPGIANGCLSIAHVQHVVQAHLAAAHSAGNGGRYILGGVNCCFADFVKTIARVSDITDTPKQIPNSLFKLYARILDLTSKVTGKEPDLTPELAKIMTRQNVSFSSQKAINELDYEIPPLEKSVTDCYRWLKKEDLI